MQKQALEPHEAAMNAIRSGQFKLRPVEVPRQQTTPAADAKDALMNAIKNRQYSLKPVSTTTVPKAGKFPSRISPPHHHSSTRHGCMQHAHFAP